MLIQYFVIYLSLILTTSRPNSWS